MKIMKGKFTLDSASIPSINILDNDNSPSAIIIHGYGGNKEEMLGLSFAVSEK